jgi:hypothetical protein
VATGQGLGLVSEAHLFALLNIATADALISCWDAKYAYSFWRPVTAIRAADTDGNPDTEPDTSWSPLLVTPNFPSYTSAHSTVSGAAAEVLTALFGDQYQFTVSAVSVPSTRSFDSFEAAAAEAGRSRIYGGIHYTFDNLNGLAVGGEVADYVIGNFLKPRGDGDDEPTTAAASAPRTVNETLPVSQVQPLLTEALAGWHAAGVDTPVPHGIDVGITDPVVGLSGKPSAGSPGRTTTRPREAGSPMPRPSRIPSSHRPAIGVSKTGWTPPWYTRSVIGPAESTGRPAP